MKIHEAANQFPMLSKSELQELADDIKINGLRVPIATHNGEIIDGRNRYEACKIAGVVPVYKEASIEDPYKWVWSMNGERRHLSSQEQKALIWRKLNSMSESMIAERERIKSEADKARAEAAKNQGRDKNGEFITGGCTDRTTTGETPKIAKTREIEARAAGVNRGAMARAVAIENKYPELAEKVATGEMKYSEAQKKANGPHVSNNSGNNEWYTPAEIIEVARSAMGGIDTDPASSDIANKTVKAITYYTKETNGLDQEWLGKVWMNPPYAQPLIGEFCKRLKEQVECGNVKSFCVLVNNATETKWFCDLVSVCDGVCFPQSRIKFVGPNGSAGAPLQGQAIAFFNCNHEAFVPIGNCFSVLK